MNNRILSAKSKPNSTHCNASQQMLSIIKSLPSYSLIQFSNMRLLGADLSRRLTHLKLEFSNPKSATILCAIKTQM